MKKKKKSISEKKANKKLVLLFLLLFLVVFVSLLDKNRKEEKQMNEQVIYFTGEINSPNYAANLLDQLDGKNKIISPYNLNSSLILLYEFTDNNTKKEIETFLGAEISKSYPYELEVKRKYEYNKKYEKLYLEYIQNFFGENYQEIIITNLKGLKKQEKDKLLVLLNQLDMSYKSMIGEQIFTIESIQKYKTTKEDEQKNANHIKTIINKTLDIYETYSIKKEIKNINYLYFNEADFTKKEQTLLIKQLENNAKQKIDFFNIVESTKIDDRIRKETNEKIKYITETIDLEGSHFLSINTLYFHSNWEIPIEKKRIKYVEFENEKKEKQIVEMMYEYVDEYYENEYAKGFRKEFEGEDYSFIGILPKEGIGTASSINLNELLSNKKEEKALIGIPKFTITKEIDCKTILEQNNIKELFSKEADFSKINKESLKLDAMIQKTSFTIAEKGSVESEIESTDLETTYQEKNTTEIVLNKPFYYLVLQKETQDILYIGKLSTLKNG